MEIKNKWSVLECPKCGKRGYYYLGSFPTPEGMDKYEYAGFSVDDLSCYKCNKKQIEIPYEQWKAEDIAEIFASELEDRNHHWLTDMPHKLLNVLNKTNLPTREFHAYIMRLFMEEMSEKWQ